MRKTLLISMFLTNTTPFNQEMTMRKTLLTLLWFAGSASLTFVIVYLFTTAPMSSSSTSTPVSNDRPTYPASESY